MRGVVWRPVWLLAMLLLAWARPGSAAPADVPEQIVYQGVLLDGAGEARTGPVDLTVRLFDALGSGTLLYKQVFPNTALTDGVFTIRLGPTGEATDSPSDPLTTSLTTALAGDPGVTLAARFLELTIGASNPLPRTQLLASPFALRSETAAVATLAEDVLAVNGLDPVALTEIFEHFAFDGSGPPNDDPREGTADADGDGIANFADSDNDNDGLSDGTEISRGSDINLITPRIVSTGSPYDDFVPTLATVTGANFEPGMSVDLNGAALATSNVQATSFDVLVPPQILPATLAVTRLNGESDSAGVTFSPTIPSISQLLPAIGSAIHPTQVAIQGAGFLVGLTVTFGGVPQTVSNVTSTSFGVLVQPQPESTVVVTVTNPNGHSATSSFDFSTGTSHRLNVNSLSNTTFDVFSGSQLAASATQSYLSGTVPPGPPRQLPSRVHISVGHDLAGNLATVFCTDNGVGCNVSLAVDNDGDHRVDDETPTILDVLPNATPLSVPTLQYDASGAAAIGYVRRTNFVGREWMVAHDRDGNGDFADTKELVSIESSPPGFGRTGLAFDSTGRIGALHADFGGQLLRLALDRNGDGDFDDAVGGNPELFTVATGADLNCGGFGFDSADRAAVVTHQAGGLTLFHDLNADGDFADAGETSLIGPAVTSCDLSTKGAGNLVVVHDGGGGVFVLKDDDDDGAFTSAGESLQVEAGPDHDPIRVDRAGGTIYVMTRHDILTAPE